MLAHSDPQRWRTFTTAEFERMIASGVLHEGERVVLIGGRIVRMAAKGPLHELCVAALGRATQRAYGFSYTIRHSSPVECSPHDLPEPDLSIVAGEPHVWRRHPRGDETVLVIEVAITTLQDDLEMVPLYASAGVPCLWIVDVTGRRVLVHEAPANGLYTRMTVHGEDDVLTPPGTAAEIRIRDVLP